MRKDSKQKEKGKVVPFDLKDKMLNQLILQSSFLPNLGLLTGKMGIAIFFVHYSKSSSEKMYEDIADELMDEIWEEIHKEIPLSLEAGLCGIGWGIEYLIQNGFVEGDSYEICEDVDKKIMEKDPRRITDYSTEKGLCGLMHYVLAHIKGCMLQKTKIPFDNMFLHDLHYAVNTLEPKKVDKEFAGLIQQYNDFCVNKKIPTYELDIKKFVKGAKVDEKKLNTFPIGLKEGISGILFEQMESLN